MEKRRFGNAVDPTDGNVEIVDSAWRTDRRSSERIDPSATDVDQSRPSARSASRQRNEHQPSTSSIAMPNRVRTARPTRSDRTRFSATGKRVRRVSSIDHLDANVGDLPGMFF